MGLYWTETVVPVHGMEVLYIPNTGQKDKVMMGFIHVKCLALSSAGGVREPPMENSPVNVLLCGSKGHTY